MLFVFFGSILAIYYRKGRKTKKILVQENSIEPKFHHINEDNVLQKTTPKFKFFNKAQFKRGIKITGLDSVLHTLFNNIIRHMLKLI